MEKVLSDLIASLAASPARISAWQEQEPALKVIDPGCGGSLPGSYAYFDPDTYALRTSQGSLFPSHPDDPLPSDAYLESLPASGLMLNGRLYPRDLWEVPSCGDVCSSSPTLRASETDQGGYQVDRTGRKVLTLKGLLKSMESTPTLTASAADQGGRVNLIDVTAHLSGRGGGVLNPRWSEWYMGFPVGWCEIPSEDSETQ